MSTNDDQKRLYADSTSGRSRAADPWNPRRTATGPVPPGAGIALPGYRDFEFIARSLGSVIYRAYQDGLDRPVAVKVLQVDDPEAAVRFQRELEITVRLGRQHPHIVTVLDTGTTAEGRPCIVMEFYDQGSLHDRLAARGPFVPAEALSVGTVVADALSFAHRHGVLHRDIKPQNILVLPTSYVVADFGIARAINAAHTGSAELFSFRHAAPQVLDGQPPSVADDIWSVGSTLFTLLDGRPPFVADDPAEDTPLAYIRRVRTMAPRVLDRPDVPPGLVAVISRCLQREPGNRFPDAAALLDALRAVAVEARSWGPRGPAAAPPGMAAPAWASANPAPPYLRPAPPPVQQPAPPPVPGPSTDGVATVLLPAVGGLPPGAPPGEPGPGQPGPPARPAAPPGAVPASVAATPGGVPASLAAVPVSRPAVHELPTGPAPGEPGPATTAPAAPRRRGRRLLFAALVAIIVGGLVGLGGTWLIGLVRDRPGGQPGGQVSVSTPAPAPAGSNVNNPELAPVLTQVDLVGSTVVLRWQDRTGGQASFIVVRVRDGRGDAVQTLPPDSTDYVVTDLDAAGPPYCFQVIAVVGRDLGVSPQRCADA